MPGQGKYTTYVPTASARNERLGRLFKGNSTVTNPFADVTESGDQQKAIEQTNARSEPLLRPQHQEGDAGQFPEGVNMDYSGNANDVSVPNLADVKWKSAGDPANAYMPDLRSPGPGDTSPTSRDDDPEISPTDIKGEGYTPGQPGVSTTRSPSDTHDQIRSSNVLGTHSPLGKNSDNEPSGF